MNGGSENALKIRGFGAEGEARGPIVIIAILLIANIVILGGIFYHQLRGVETAINNLATSNNRIACTLWYSPEERARIRKEVEKGIGSRISDWCP